MEAIDIDDPQANLRTNAVGVKDNRLVVTTLPQDYGTFAVSTDENFNRLPYRRARSFRIHNVTGKLGGVRARHDKVVSDDFEAGLTRWSGTADVDFSTDDLEGAKTMLVKGGYAYARLDGGTLADESVLELTFKVSRGKVNVGIFDDAANVSLIDGLVTGVTVGFADNGTVSTTAGASSATWTDDTLYRLEIEMVPSTQKFNAHLFTGKTRQEIAQNADASNSGGLTGTLADYLIAVSGDSIEVDSVTIRKKVSNQNEIMTTGASYVYPCERSISEWEVINLGSDAQSFSDNTEDITLTGFHAV